MVDVDTADLARTLAFFQRLEYASKRYAEVTVDLHSVRKVSSGAILVLVALVHYWS